MLWRHHVHKFRINPTNIMQKIKIKRILFYSISFHFIIFFFSGHTKIDTWRSIFICHFFYVILSTLRSNSLSKQKVPPLESFFFYLRANKDKRGGGLCCLKSPLTSYYYYYEFNKQKLNILMMTVKPQFLFCCFVYH